ncbi:FliA/WhiG family RNA polymerase sigma factor [uncultured Selenomonas sp.]|uniref:FliA/WhiG family RNA polymerase sigma factor n=1 Tax=uncultured Selenomonas sp. TaxID=159275 RepID=UPI00258DC001|nr:FliA/WhiG family RNA polymerase sigma factor [uncultured Selenomonas sp.]
MGKAVSQEASQASKAAADIEALWSSYKKEQDIEQRNALIEHYLPLVRLVAGRLAIGLPSHVDRDDLLSSGFFGLLDAIERYDPTRRNKFETYAGVRIRGAMLDYLRAKDWMPVTMRQRIRKYSDVSAQLASELGREATDEEIRERMGIGEKEYRVMLRELGAATLIPLDDYLAGGGEKAAEDGGPSAQLEATEIKETLAAAIDRLPEKERIVVSLYYYDELTLKEISKILHLTEARISQLHSKAVFRLRGSLARMKANLL